MDAQNDLAVLNNIFEAEVRCVHITYIYTKIWFSYNYVVILKSLDLYLSRYIN